MKEKLLQLDCAHRAQTSAEAYNLNWKWSGIRIRINSDWDVCRSTPNMLWSQSLLASVILPSVVKISLRLY